MIKQDRGTPFEGTANSGTTAIVTQAGTSNQVIYITDITASISSGTGTLVVKDGSTIIWQDNLTTTPYVLTLTNPIHATAGNAITVTTTGLASNNVNANVSGFLIKSQLNS